MPRSRGPPRAVFLRLPRAASLWRILVRHGLNVFTTWECSPHHDRIMGKPIVPRIRPHTAEEAPMKVPKTALAEDDCRGDAITESSIRASRQVDNRRGRDCHELMRKKK